MIQQTIYGLSWTTLVILLLSWSAESVIVGRPSELVSIASAMSRLAERNILTYMDTCSFQEELKRVKLARKILQASVDTSQLSYQELLPEINALTDSGNFCNSSQYLHCNSGGHCDCSSSEHMGILSRFVREDGLCRIAQGSVCFIRDLEKQREMTKEELLCQSGTECAMKNTGVNCTIINLVNGIRKSLGPSPNITTVRRVVVSKLAEGICTCMVPVPTKQPKTAAPATTETLVSFTDKYSTTPSTFEAKSAAKSDIAAVPTVKNQITFKADPESDHNNAEAEHLINSVGRIPNISWLALMGYFVCFIYMRN